MSDVMEYYLTGGEIRIGKKEFAFEMLRRDGVLRVFGGIKARPVIDSDDDVIISFVRGTRVKLDGDPTPMLGELKQRYGARIGGKLYFTMVFTTTNHINFMGADLDMDEIVLRAYA